MAKVGKRVLSDWRIGTHTVNSYKARVGDPAVKRKRRKSKKICTIIAKALNKVRDQGRNVEIRAEEYNGKPKIKQLYKITLFKSDYYILCSQNQVITLFTHEMIESDAKRGGLTFLESKPFDELKVYCADSRN